MPDEIKPPYDHVNSVRAQRFRQSIAEELKPLDEYDLQSILKRIQAYKQHWHVGT